MKKVNIGKVVSVTNDSIDVMINVNHMEPYLIINSNVIKIGGVGNYVRVKNFVYEIISDKATLELENKYINDLNTSKILKCNLIGYFHQSKFIQGSNGEYPSVFDDVYTLIDSEISKIYLSGNLNDTISFGSYLFQQNIRFNVDVNKFFASHCLIVGNTGSGKSNTLNTIFSTLFDKYDVKNSNFLIIDTNGEYSNAFTSSKTIRYLGAKVDSDDQIRIPINLLNCEDWKLLLEATEKTQYPIIKSVWRSIEKNIFELGKDIGRYIVNEIIKTLITIFSSNANPSIKMAACINLKSEFAYLSDTFYQQIEDLFRFLDEYTINGTRIVSDNNFVDSTSDLIDKIKNYKCNVKKNCFTVEDFGVLLNACHLMRIYKYNMSENNTSPLIGRFHTHKSDFEKIFDNYIGTTGQSLMNYVFGNDNILVCNVADAKKDIRRIMVTFICSKLYNEVTKIKRGNKSLHLIIDEAHNYLSNQSIDKEDPIAKTCIETFETIIKEGRKFGVFLTMSTQRPSDITPTLLSQAHNYVIHKLVNPKDIDVIKNTVPFIDSMSIKMLSILASGQAIFSGTAFSRPNIVKIDFNANNSKVESETIKLTQNWNKWI